MGRSNFKFFIAPIEDKFNKIIINNEDFLIKKFLEIVKILDPDNEISRDSIRLIIYYNQNSHFLYVVGDHKSYFERFSKEQFRILRYRFAKYVSSFLNEINESTQASAIPNHAATHIHLKDPNQKTFDDIVRMLQNVFQRERHKG